jgi:hypothetical protein
MGLARGGRGRIVQQGSGRTTRPVSASGQGKWWGAGREAWGARSGRGCVTGKGWLVSSARERPALPEANRRRTRSGGSFPVCNVLWPGLVTSVNPFQRHPQNSTHVLLGQGVTAPNFRIRTRHIARCGGGREQGTGNREQWVAWHRAKLATPRLAHCSLFPVPSTACDHVQLAGVVGVGLRCMQRKHRAPGRHAQSHAAELSSSPHVTKPRFRVRYPIGTVASCRIGAGWLC